MAQVHAPLTQWKEEDRLKVLDSYGILDTPSEEDFEDIVAMAAAVLDVPVSLISFVTRGRQWFKAALGTDLKETPLNMSICSHAILQDQLFVVPDTTKDQRFTENPLVSGDPHVRFYAGALLQSPEGLPIGTVCVLDYKPRTLTTQQANTLKALARQVMTLLELRRALSAKSRSEERLNLALEASGFVGVWEWDIVRDRVYADDRFISAFGGEPSWNTEGAPISDYLKAIHPEDLPRVSAAIQHAMHPGETFKQEYRLVQKDGSFLWIEARGKCHFDESGKPVRFPGVGVDVTERRQAQARSEFLSHLTQTLSLLSSPEDLNRVATRQVGEFLGGNRCYFFEAVQPDLWCRVLPDWHVLEIKTLEGTYDLAIFGEPQMWETLRTTSVCINDSSQHSWTKKFYDNYRAMDIGAAWIVPFTRDGRWVACLGISSLHPRSWNKDEREFLENVMSRVWPLIERARIEVTLRENEGRFRNELERLVDERTTSLREAVSQMEEFSYSVSHDLRAPLRAMQGYATALLEDYRGKFDEEGQEYLKHIVSAANRMERLTHDVLVYSKIPRTSFQLNAVDLDRLVSDVIQQNLPEKAKEVGITIDRPLLPVLGNESFLSQSVSNLIDNAVKFASKERSLRVHVWTEHYQNQIRLYVEDNGIGILPEHQSRVWGMFERVHPRDLYEGTGIGLAIVRKTVERMNGLIGLESDGLTGCRFWIQLPGIN